jgi:aspartate/methionine/tyrosine aminotransferase
MAWENRIRPQPMFDILQLVQQQEHLGNKIIHLEIGDTTGFKNETLRSYIAAAVEEIPFSYSPSVGELELRKVAARIFSQDLSMQVDPQQIAVAPANALIIQSIASVTSPGDVVLIPDPGFPSYELASTFLGLETVRYGVFEDGVPKIESLKSIKAKLGKRSFSALIINNPSNPLGHYFSWEEYQDLIDFAGDAGATIVLDETYINLVFGMNNTNPLITDLNKVIRLRSLSKEHAAPGLRIGFCMASDQNIKTISNFSSMVFSCLPSFVQVGSARYLNSDESKAFTMSLNQELRERFALFNHINSQTGMAPRYIPNAGFYGFIGVKNGDRVFKNLLERFKVAVCPGSAFGPKGGDAIRVSLAGSLTDVQIGLGRVVKGIQIMESEGSL